MRERCVRGPQDVVKFSELRTTYAEWAKDIGGQTDVLQGFRRLPASDRTSTAYVGL